MPMVAGANGTGGTVSPIHTAAEMGLRCLSCAAAGISAPIMFRANRMISLQERMRMSNGVADVSGRVSRRSGGNDFMRHFSRWDCAGASSPRPMAFTRGIPMRGDRLGGGFFYAAAVGF